MSANSMPKSARGNQLKVFVGLTVGLVLAGLPLLNKKVYQREQDVAAMRDAQYSGETDKASAKDAARDSRLKRGH